MALLADLIPGPPASPFAGSLARTAQGGNAANAGRVAVLAANDANSISVNWPISFVKLIKSSQVLLQPLVRMSGRAELMIALAVSDQSVLA